MASLRGRDPLSPAPPGAIGAPTPRRLALALIVLLLLPALLGACGAGRTPTAGGGTPTRAASTASPRAATPTAAALAPTLAPAPSPAATTGPTGTATVAPTPRPARTPAPIGLNGPGFGMTMHFMWYDLGRAIRELDEMEANRLTVARFDVSWRNIEPVRKGGYDVAALTKLDTILREMDERGIAPIITVIETPAWARPAGTNLFMPPSDLQDYADFVGVLAARYADRPTMVWEIWNEPNLIEFWESGPNPTEYTDMLKRSYKAIKAAAPQSTVLGGSIVFNDLKFLRGMYQQGARNAFDGLALHPYAPGRAPDDRRDPSAMFLAVEDMKAVMTANGDPDKAIWITEMGWGLDLVTDESRAAYLKRAIELVRTWPYVRTFCVYTLSQEFGPDAQSFGLINVNGSPSQSWTAYIDATQGR